MRKNVVILVGLPGTGKSLAASYIKKSKWHVYRMGSLTDDFLKKRNLEETEKNEREVRRELRDQFGPDIYARNVLEKIVKYRKIAVLTVIEGMRSIEEWEYFKKNIENPVIIYLEADKSKRIERLIKRKIRPLSLSEITNRENYEINKLRIQKIKNLAKFIVENNASKKEFYKKLNEVLENV